MGLTKMAGMNCFTTADFFSSSSDSTGGSSAKRRQFIKFALKSGRENMNGNTKHSPGFSVSWKETESTWQVCIVLLVGSMSSILKNFSSDLPISDSATC